MDQSFSLAVISSITLYFVFKIYKEFSINKLKENKIEIVYIIKPLWGGNDVFENGLSKNCYTKKEITEVLDSYLLQQCKELNN